MANAYGNCRSATNSAMKLIIYLDVYPGGGGSRRVLMRGTGVRCSSGMAGQGRGDRDGMRLGRDTGSALASLGRGLTAPGGCDGALGHGQDRGRPQGGGQGRSGLREPSGPPHTGKAEPKCTQ